MYPLKTKYKVGYRHGEWTFYGVKHRGIDLIVPENTPVYAPFNGEITRAFKGKQGGYTLWLRPDHDDVIIRFLHLYEMLPITGRVEKGDIIAYTGNTGLSTNPHLHLDLSRGSVKLKDFSNFIDPEKYFNEENMKLTKQQVEKLYTLWGMNLDEEAINYWAGKNLDELLNQRIKDRIKELQEYDN